MSEALSDVEIFNSFAASAAPLTEVQIEKIEQRAQQTGVARRLALAVLKFSGEELVQKMKDDKAAKAFADIELCLADYLRWLGGMTEMANAAHARTALALCARDDMRKLLAAANRRNRKTSRKLES